MRIFALIWNGIILVGLGFVFANNFDHINIENAWYYQIVVPATVGGAGGTVWATMSRIWKIGKS